MKLKLYSFCGLVFLLISCRAIFVDSTGSNTNSYPDFHINIKEPKSLYAFGDTLTYNVYKIQKEGNIIFLSTEERENNLKEYWIERVDSLEHNFQIIPYYIKRNWKRLYHKKGIKWKKTHHRRKSNSSGWVYGSPIPDWRKFDTLFLNMNRIGPNQVSCQLSYWHDTTEVYFETKGVIKYDK